MFRSPRTAALVIVTPLVFGLSSCAALVGAPDTKSDSLARVDELLARVERVQVEAVVAKERAHTALEALRAIAAPDFQGDPQAAHVALVQSIDDSRRQANALASSAPPLRAAAESVFYAWTADLESFGNKGMRKRSQARLEDTRTRCDAILNSLVAAQIAYESFNDDIHDQALFLANDFNAAAVAVIASDVEELDEQTRELDSRLEACVAASKAYVESTALRGQLGGSSDTQAQQNAGDESQQPRRTGKRKKPAAPEAGASQVSSAAPSSQGTP